MPAPPSLVFKLWCVLRHVYSGQVKSTGQCKSYAVLDRGIGPGVRLVGAADRYQNPWRETSLEGKHL
jgi:hypothetical protein